MAGRKTMRLGILTSGGDCPGLNAAIRGVVKSALARGDEVLGIADGYRGLIEGRARPLGPGEVSDLLTRGGTILGASREKPFAGAAEGREPSDAAEALDKGGLIKATYRDLGLDCLMVLGGNGTQTTAARLQEEGLRVIGLPKTIDNDIWGTEISFGFHSAVDIATESIDRLHSTASSHNRVMVIELMGHKAGWLALHAGIAGGGDVILLPEIPYSRAAVAEGVLGRARAGKPFSIVVVAEGALGVEEAALDKKERRRLRAESPYPSIGYRVAAEIAADTGMETRVTVLGYLQRGGVPVPHDRLLATAFGSAAADMAHRGEFGSMVAMRGGATSSIPLAEVAGRTRKVPPDHELLRVARRVGAVLGEG